MKNNENKYFFESPAMNIPKSLLFNYSNEKFKNEINKNNFISPSTPFDLFVNQKFTPNKFYISEFNILNEGEKKKDVGVQVDDSLLFNYLNEMNTKEFQTPKTNYSNSKFEDILLESNNSLKKNLNSEFNEDNITKNNFTCNCKKSKCLKLYCECFRNGISCGLDCNCKDCFNTDSNEDLRKLLIQETMSKNPLAFEKIVEDNRVITKGCKCVKTNCNKKYCECFAFGNSCGPMCKCKNCLNNKQDESKEKIENYKNLLKLKKKEKADIKYHILKKCELINQIKKKN